MKIEEAINIMEPGAEPTDEQLDRIQEDADLREACQDIMIMQGILAEEKESAEPRPELPVKDNASSFTRILIIALAAAAVFAGAFFLLHHLLLESIESNSESSDKLKRTIIAGLLF